ncbi:MAG: VWA domain-containing protein [Flavobacteriaceae bacterium]|nr:VWA domain-containing protein [Flavobacteriaceae bacterium]
MKKISFLSAMLAVIFALYTYNTKSQTIVDEQTTSQQTNNIPAKDSTKIQVALLLDTSNSMDGLIDQAKSRLWDIVNTLTTLKYKGVTPSIEISLYEYGNDGLSKAENFIRQVTPMNNDLDLLSEKLFALRTNGGLEYCGAVIQRAVSDIDWGTQESDMKLIYIAGNEEFNQGGVSYKESVAAALGKGIYVNTIYCGNRELGISELWQDGATRGEGKYFNIDSDAKIRYIVTPYDDRIDACNTILNNTYIGYGVLAEERTANQAAQDSNAGSISKENKVSRAISKSKAVYKNDSWDLVDKYEKDKNAIKNLKESEMPKEYKGKSKVEIEAIVKEKQAERSKIQSEISELAKQRQAYIDAEMKKTDTDTGADDLGKAINSSIIAFSKTKGYEIAE